MTGQLASEGAKQLKEHSEPSSTRHYRWLNQEAVGEANHGFWKERKEVQVESQQAVWRGFTCWHSGCGDMAGSYCVSQSSYLS